MRDWPNVGLATGALHTSLIVPPPNRYDSVPTSYLMKGAATNTRRP